MLILTSRSHLRAQRESQTKNHKTNTKSSHLEQPKVLNNQLRTESTNSLCNSGLFFGGGSCMQRKPLSLNYFNQKLARIINRIPLSWWTGSGLAYPNKIRGKPFSQSYNLRLHLYIMECSCFGRNNYFVSQLGWEFCSCQIKTPAFKNI